jgi:hypothetical protein
MPFFFVCHGKRRVHVVIGQQRPERDALLAALRADVVSGDVRVKQCWRNVASRATGIQADSQRGL